MSWTRVFVLTLLTTLLILTFCSVVRSAAVRGNTKAANSKGSARKVFTPESDASNFLKRRSRRSTRYYEFLEQNERSRETNEQYREYHYDGLQPRYYWFH
ncbi:hypothetical protein FQN60_005509 [Etheostoma spectabile]|uniref:Unique cartilage matrix-associated protein n=1 Tax=Etheostoma spectabile TaxID=54343 RepID=A0A5J5CDF8_9PERO|nr:hypothetical protein FQN60_005509 [Etheostoma spectabile]